MKKNATLTVFLIMICLSSCDMVLQKRNTVPIKPFYVIEKDASDYLSCKYTLLDSKGNRFYIVDDRNKYSIGDTIK